MSVSVKRKRGRPRLDEPREIKDFDTNLIQEFKKFPVFYDRQHPQHRDREYTDQIWQDIAQTLNVSPSLVKTRMLQLRNRFNLEKRRVEAMKETHHSSVTSQWSLYENLSFLGNYVKSRRPYSMPASYNSKANSTASSSGGEEEDAEVGGNAFNSNQTLTSDNLLKNNINAEGLCTNTNHLLNDIASPQHSRNIQGNNQNDDGSKELGSKYNAFGQFLASSLIEMNDIQALTLVEKFTADLVKFLKSEDKKKSFISVSHISNTDGDDENSLSVY